MSGITPIWRHVERIDGLAVWLGELDNGKWLAMRDKSPRFCFEAETPELATAIARRAIARWLPPGRRRRKTAINQ